MGSSAQSRQHRAHGGSGQGLAPLGQGGKLLSCPCGYTKPLTCENTSSAQQQRQALHLVEGVEVVDILVQAIHSVLMLPAEML